MPIRQVEGASRQNLGGFHRDEVITRKIDSKNMRAGRPRTRIWVTKRIAALTGRRSKGPLSRPWPSWICVEVEDVHGRWIDRHGDAARLHPPGGKAGETDRCRLH